MKYKLNIQKKAGFLYEVENGLLKINGTVIEEPVDTEITAENIKESEKALGVTQYYREGEEAVCQITKYVNDKDFEYYKNYTIKEGKPSTQTSKWDITKLLTADEVIRGNRRV